MDADSASGVQRRTPESGVQLGQQHATDVEDHVGLLDRFANRRRLEAAAEYRPRYCGMDSSRTPLSYGVWAVGRFARLTSSAALPATPVAGGQSRHQGRRAFRGAELGEDGGDRRLEFRRVAALAFQPCQWDALHRGADHRHHPVGLGDDDVGRHRLTQRLPDQPLEFLDAVVRVSPPRHSMPSPRSGGSGHSGCRPNCGG